MAAAVLLLPHLEHIHISDGLPLYRIHIPKKTPVYTDYVYFQIFGKNYFKLEITTIWIF